MENIAMGRHFLANKFRSMCRIFCEELSRVVSLPSDGAAIPFKKKNDIDKFDVTLLNVLRNRHLGQRCFVIGNGPSLTIEDLEKLRFEYTLASNKIYLAFEKTEWRPTYYSCEDGLVMDNNHDAILALERTLKIFPSRMFAHMNPDASCFFMDFIPAPTRLDPKASPDDRNFSYDLTKGIHWGSTITYTLIQLAVFMGFKEIYLLGVDHSYVTPNKMDGHYYICEGEVNHFHKDYRKPGEPWHDPRVDVLERSYAYAREACEKVGVSIYNASRKTALNVFEKIDLDAVLAQKNR